MCRYRFDGCLLRLVGSALVYEGSGEFSADREVEDGTVAVHERRVGPLGALVGVDVEDEPLFGGERVTDRVRDWNSVGCACEAWQVAVGEEPPPVSSMSIRCRCRGTGRSGMPSRPGRCRCRIR